MGVLRCPRTVDHPLPSLPESCSHCWELRGFALVHRAARDPCHLLSAPPHTFSHSSVMPHSLCSGASWVPKLSLPLSSCCHQEPPLLRDRAPGPAHSCPTPAEVQAPVPLLSGRGPLPSRGPSLCGVGGYSVRAERVPAHPGATPRCAPRSLREACTP